MIQVPSQKIRLLLTQKCNANCFYCHGEGLSKLFNERIDAEFVKKLLNLVKCKEVILSGGEPTLYPQLLEICKEVKANGTRLCLNTNGSQYNVMAKIAPYMDEVHVSLDTLNKHVYRHIKELPLQTPLKTIDLYKKKGIDIKINVPFSRFVDLDEMIMFAEEEDVELRLIEIMSKGLNAPDVSIDSTEETLLDNGFHLKETVEYKNYWVKGNYKIVTLKCVCMNAVGLGRANKARNLCRRKTNLYVVPSGDIKPCILSGETIPLYSDLMNNRKAKALASVKRAISMLGYGKCIQAIELRGKTEIL